MFKRRKLNINKDEIIAHFQKAIKEQESKYKYVKSKEYEDWLVAFLNKHKQVSDFEDLYLYDKPEGFTDDDIEKINLLHYFWDVIDNTTKESDIPNFDDLFIIEPDKTIKINIQGHEYNFERNAGCGCYVYSIGEIK
jgi:hypothetical protein